MRQYCELDDGGRILRQTAAQRMQLSEGAIADLAGCERIQTAHMAEAIQYRQRKAQGCSRLIDRLLWHPARCENIPRAS